MLVVLLCLNARTASAATCIWTGATSSTYSQSGNWTGGGCGSGPPASGDVAQFSNATPTNNCVITASTTIGAVSISAGTVTLSSGVTLTVTGDYTQSGGTFVGGSGGGGNLRVAGAFNKTAGTFTHGSGQVMLNATSAKAFASNGATFYDLVVNDGVAGYWRLDTGSGSTATDRSGYGNDATLNNATWVTAGVDLPSALAFKNDAAVSFNGSSSSISLGVNSAPALNGAQTVSMWVYYPSIPATQQSFLSIASGTNRNQIGFFDTAGARSIRIWKRVGTTDTSLVTASSTPASGWHHVAYTYNGSTHTLYVDGTATTSGTAATTGTPNAATLGMRTDSAEFFSGTIDDVRIYKRALSATEVGRLYGGGQPQTSVATQTLSGAPIVINDLVIASGTLTAGANAITVGGNWDNFGGLFSGTATVTFNGSATTNVIRAGGQSFGGISVTGSGTWTLGDALSMSGRTITVSAGALTGLSYAIRAGTITEPGGNFTPGTGAVTLDGSTDATLPDGSYGALTIDTSENSLVGYWKLDEGTGTSFSDSSGNGNTGTLVSGPTWSTSVPSTIRFADADSLSITGGATNDHGEVPVSGLNLNPNSGVTIAYWMYYASIPAVSSDAVVLKSSGLLQTGFLKGSSGPCTGVCIGVWNSGGGGTPLAYKTSPSTTAGWYHFAYTWDGVTSKVYINGTAATSTTNPPTSSIINTVYLSTYDGTSEDFTGGKIDDVRLYNTALTATQVLQLANGYLTSVTLPTYTLGGTTSVTGALALTNGGISVGSQTLTASSGLTVAANGTVTMAASGGTLAIGSGQSLIMDGILNASSTGATIRSVSGNYAFRVGSTSTARATLNLTGLAVTNTDTNGMWINANTASITTFTRFDNIAFSSGTGAQLLQIYAPSLLLTSSGCTFDSGAGASTTNSVKLTGNGTADGETRIIFGGSTCASDFASCQASKSDDDPDNNGIGNTPASNGAVVQFVRAATNDTAGSVEGLPTAAFDWNTFTYYSTYVAFHDASGTADRIYVRDQAGTAKYSWDTPSGETIVGTPRWNTTGTTHYLYVALASGKVYRLIDNGSSLAPDSSGNWAGANNPFNCGCTIVSPLAMDASNLYWGGTTAGPTAQKAWTVGQVSRAQPVGSPLTITPTITTSGPALAVVGGITYLGLGLTGHILAIDITNQTIAADNTNPGTHAIFGRLATSSSRAFAGDDGGRFWAIDFASFGGTNKAWSYTVASDSIRSSPYYDHASTIVHFGTDGGKVVALNSSGAALTGYPYVPGSTSDSIRTAMLYTGGLLIVGTTTGKLFFIDRNNGTTGPALIRQYYFGGTRAVSGVGYDASVNRYMVSTADPSSNDGRLYTFDLVADPTPGTP